MRTTFVATRAAQCSCTCRARAHTHTQTYARTHAVAILFFVCEQGGALSEEAENAKKFTKIIIEGTVERAEPTVHFEYALEVTNANGETYTIFRRYRRFDELLGKIADMVSRSCLDF